MALNTANLILLAAELLAGHPDTGAYDADAHAAQNELNEYNRPGTADISKVLEYLLLERFRTNTGTDTELAQIYGRMAMVARSNPGENVLGAIPINLTTIESIAACQAALKIVDSQIGVNINLLDTRFDTIWLKVRDADCMGNGDKNNLQAVANGAQSRAEELGFGLVKANDVILARAL